MMHSFTDNRGRTWSVSMDAAAFKRVSDTLGIKLEFAVFGGPLLERLAGNAELLVNVLYILCKPQADARGVSDEEFGRALGGEAVADATDAMLRALADFMPESKRRVVLAAYNAEQRRYAGAR